MINGQLEIALLILFIWLVVVTFFLIRSVLRYRRIFRGTHEESAVELLQKLTKEQDIHKREIVKLLDQVAKLEQNSRSHMQKIGLIRFNPFKDTGGDQSFVLALTDEKYTGIVISGLYSRSGTRWYAKKIVEGKGVEYELSEEEKKAISLAK
jgi:cell division protein FtsB